MRQLGVLTVLLVAGAASAAAQRVSGEGVLHDATGKEVGRVQMSESAGRVIISIHVRGLPPGVHGVHLHQVGKCDPPGFESAGGHYNPLDREHGRRNPRGAHLGDFGNITVGGNGWGDRTVTMTSRLARQGLNAVLGDGRALVIHADQDDEKTDPSGNSGARIACAVVMP